MDRTLIKNVRIISMDSAVGDFASADILIEDGTIRSVGEPIDAADAQLVDGSDRIAIPGFVDTHRHLWQSAMRGLAADWTLTQYLTGVIGLIPTYRPEDVHASNLLGTLEALDSGITTVLDWCQCLPTPDHADAAIAGLRESGSRAVFACGLMPSGSGPEEYLDPNRHSDWTDLKRLRSQYFSSDDQLITLAAAPRGPDFSSVDAAQADWQAARELGVRISVHMGVGGFAERPLAQLHERGLLGADTTYIHCSRLEDDELKMIAESGGSASVAAEVELHMGHGFPPTGRMVEAGVRPSLSVDVCTGVAGDMFGQMRVALATQRGLDNHALLEAGKAPDSLELTARDILEFATIEGARACGLAEKIGSITPGKQADLVLLRTDRLNMVPLNNPAAAVALAANTANVDTVMVAGEIVKRDGELIADLKQVTRQATDSRDYLIERAGIELGGAWAPTAYSAS